MTRSSPTREGVPERAPMLRPADDVRGRGRLVTPIRLVIVVALIGSLAYLAYALTVRDTSQIPMLASGAAVLGIVFLILAVSGARGTVEAGRAGRGGKALVVAMLGGIAATIAFGCFAGAIVLALVQQAA
jgi:hypothetical protein